MFSSTISRRYHCRFAVMCFSSLQVFHFDADESLLRIEGKRMNRGCKFRILLQIDLEGDHVASAGDSRMGTSLLSVDQAFDVFYDAL